VSRGYAQYPFWIAAGAGGGGYTLTADAGSFTLAGQSAATRVARKVAAGAGSHALTGLAVGLRAGRKVASGAGAFSLSGLAAGTIVARRLPSEAGVFSLTGASAATRAARRIAAASGIYTLSGQAVQLLESGAGFTLAAAAGSFAATGLDIALRPARRAGATVGVFVLTGRAVLLLTDGIAPQEKPIRTVALDAIVAALVAAEIVVGGRLVTVERARTDAVPPDDRPLLVVHGGDMEALPADTLAQRYALRVVLAGFVAAADEAAAESEAAELHAYAVRALIRPDPAALPVPLVMEGGAELWMIERGLRVEAASVAQSEEPLASFVADFTAELHTTQGNPFVTV
jgi:hypothetical protein